MTIPTKEQIAAEIAALLEIKPRVVRTSAFGDNHHDAIDRQISVLKSGLSEDEVHEDADAERWADNVRDEAVGAAQWLHGEFLDYPRLVDAWKGLAR